MDLEILAKELRRIANSLEFLSENPWRIKDLMQENEGLKHSLKLSRDPNFQDAIRGLGARARRVIVLRLNASSPDEIRQMTDEQILDMKDCGAATLREIRKVFPRE